MKDTSPKNVFRAIVIAFAIVEALVIIPIVVQMILRRH